MTHTYSVGQMTSIDQKSTAEKFDTKFYENGDRILDVMTVEQETSNGLSSNNQTHDYLELMYINVTEF